MAFSRNLLLIYCLVNHLTFGGARRSQSFKTYWRKSSESMVRERRNTEGSEKERTLNKQKEVVLGLLIPYKVTGGADLSGYSGGEYYAAAFMLAIEDINNDTMLLPNIKIRYVWNDTMCLVDLAIKSQLWQHSSFQGEERTGVDAFIGTGCKCTTVVRNAVALNMPIISHMCLDPELANRTIFPTFARTAAMYKHLTPTLIALLDSFKWKRVAVFIERTALDEDAAEYVVKKMKSENITIAIKNYLPSPPNHVPTLDDNHELVIKMREAKRKARSKHQFK
ncbi:guanylate cyclase 32E-like [Rhopilema esculentum]|uniref:guanylate cyclase 32E-like n=1 Tax=Rhopilema esculentum TaxID=499914 RepID=UPI0031E061F7